MVLRDFEYNGELLSEHGCILGSVSNSYDTSVSLGSNLTLNTVKNNNIDMITSTEYPNPIKLTFDIVKASCKRDIGVEFSEFDVERLMVWLNRKGFYKFKPIYDYDFEHIRRTDYMDLIFFGTFTDITALRIGGRTIGYSLTFTTNAPYGYAEKSITELDINPMHRELHIYNSSQELGYLYPDKVEIKCGTSGTISFKNLTDPAIDRVTEINNCITDEIITLDCKNRIITSNVEHKTLYNDFNYNFPRLVREYIETDNVIVIDTNLMPYMTVTYEYYPIRKVGVIV